MPRRSTHTEAAENQAPQAAASAVGVTKPGDALAAPAPAEAPSVPHRLLEAAGLCRSADGGYLLADAFMFRQKMERACRDPATKEEFLSALAEHFSSDPKELRAALQPTRGHSSSTGTGASTGSSSCFGDAAIKDSVVRLLLQCASVQTPLATALLESVADHQEELEGGAATHTGMALPKLILSQFRWLEHVADGNGKRAPWPCAPIALRPTRLADPGLAACLFLAWPSSQPWTPG